MRDEVGVVKKTHLKKYEVVAEILRQTYEFTQVGDLAKMAEMDEKDFRCSISVAKRFLATHGVIIVNKIGLGYKVGTFNELKTEVDKSCKRALAHLAGMAKNLNLLEASGMIRNDFDLIRSLIEKNLDSIEVLFDSPNYEDYESFEDFADAYDDFKEEYKLIPEKIEQIPYEDA